MFDGSLPEVADLSALEDAELVDAAGGWAAAENAACARKLAVMAELFARRTGLADGERELWWCDPEAAVGAELAAAQNVSTWMALAQAHRGVVLADRLPKVAALFEAGLINEPLVRAIESRTGLIADSKAIAQVDALIAEQVMAWGPLSVRKTEQAIDALVVRVDPGALRRSRATACSRDVKFGSPTDEPGYTSMWARLYGPDGQAFESRVEAMARGVCEDDPRPLHERRNDALAAVGNGLDALACQCGDTACPVAGREVPATATVIHVVADATTVEAARNQGSADVQPAFCPAPAAAFVIGAGVMPTPLLAEFIKRATLRDVGHPGDAPPEPQYRPSRELADFVRSRDLTCRWPGCDKPAYGCDIDHTVAWPVGPTHASNLKCYCRFHHLLKTFYCGVGGWREQQLPDGSLILTSPTGHVYTTRPGSALLFPSLCRPTGELHLPAHVPKTECERGTMMPRRRRTRAENFAKRIEAERRLNDHYVAERNKPPPF